jgi:3-hydroxybutyryl-CoA dehydrogenase
MGCDAGLKCPIANICKHLASVRRMHIRHVGIVGSGIMGAGIAEVITRAGMQVTLLSRSAVRAGETSATFEAALRRQVERGKLEASTQADMVTRLSVTTNYGDLGTCDLVIESIAEDLDLKRTVFAKLDATCPPHTILATNTSTLPVVELAMETKRPDRVCGIHFFNPASAMKLVEVVKQLTTSDETMTAALSFVATCGKDAVVVKDRAGFVVNALLFPYLNNAVRMLENCVASRDDIDSAMKGGCGFPMGPFALLDLVGLDTSVAILDALYNESRDAHVAPHPMLRRMVSAGHLGRKSGCGFYDYSTK